GGDRRQDRRRLLHARRRARRRGAEEGQGQGAGRMTLHTGAVGAGVDRRAAHPADAAALLRTTGAVRSRSAQLLERARSGMSRWFVVRDDLLPAAADEVAAVTHARYPDLKIPYHSRWRHFEAGGVDRRADLDDRATVDLTVVSVLLDAGAGPDWR